MSEPQKITIPIDKFKGLITSIASPPVGSAKSLKNFVLNRKKNALQNAPGYGLKWIDGEAEYGNLPQSTNAEGPNYINPTLWKISDITWIRHYNFHTKMHGGKELTFLVGKYTKTAFYTASPTTDRLCVFVRPYWSGAAWIDSWKDLTDFFIFTHLRQTVLDVEDGFCPGVSFTNDATVGTIDWSNPGNAAADDGSYASVALTHLDVSKYLMVKNVTWNHTHPIGCTLVGLEVKVIRYASIQGMGDNSIRAVKDGAVFGDDKIDIYWLLTPDEEKIYGDSSDDWGGLVMDDTDSDQFGVAISVINLAGSNNTAYIDAVLFKRYYTMPDSDKIYIDDGIAFDFKTIDPSGELFNDSSFVGYIAYFKDSTDVDRFFVISECGYDTTHHYYPDDAYYIKTLGLPTEGLPPDNDKIYFYKFYMPEYAGEGNLTDDIDPHFYAVSDGIRIATGSDSTDSLIKSMLAEKTWGWTSPLNETDEIVCESAKMVLPINDFTMDRNEYGSDFNPGTYYGKITFSDDDGNESSVLASSSITWSTTPSNPKILLTLDRAVIPKSASYINFYMSVNDVLYNHVLLIELAGEDVWTKDDVTGTIYIEKEITEADWNVGAGPELSTNIDRATTDVGYIRPAHVSLMGDIAYAVNVYTSQNLKNTIMISAVHGDGNTQYDIFPLKAECLIDLEYSDGDELQAIINLDDKIVAIKSNTIIVLYRNASGGYDRKIISKGNGICSVKSLEVFEDYLYCNDYSAILRYSMRGEEVLNLLWLEDWKAIANAVKESSFSVLDDFERQLRVSLASLEYIFDLDTALWSIQDFADVPIAYSRQINGTVDFLTQSAIFSIGRSHPYHNLVNFNMEYETNEIYASDAVGPEGNFMDLQVDKISIDYISDVDITVDVFVAGSAAACDSFVFSSTKRNGIFEPCDDARGKSFRLKISASTIVSTSDYNVLIEKLAVMCTLNPISGDILSEP